MRSLVWGLLTAVVTFSGWPLPEAHACTAPVCSRAFVFPAGGAVPADHVRLLYNPGGDPTASLDAGLNLPRLYRLEGDVKVAVPFDYTVVEQAVAITPMVSQPVGTRLVLETETALCSLDTPLHAEYTITDAAALPTMLGTLTASTRRAMLPVAVDSGACSDSADVAVADLTITLTPEAQPFASILHYQLFVDSIPRTSFIDTTQSNYRLPQGQDRVYALCNAPDGFVGTSAIAAGAHRVYVTASIGDERPIQTAAIDVLLACDGSAPMDAGVTPIDDMKASKVEGSCQLSRPGILPPLWFACMLIALMAYQRRRR